MVTPKAAADPFPQAHAATAGTGPAAINFSSPVKCLRLQACCHWLGLALEPLDHQLVERSDIGAR